MHVKYAILLLVAAIIGFNACDDDDTYADRIKRERKQISSFLTSGVKAYAGTDTSSVMLDIPGNIKVISEEEFYANDSTTNVDENEYVLFSGSGVYMQIIRQGSGQKLSDGETSTILCRYTEYNIASDTIISSNNAQYFAPYPDIMSVTNSGGIYTGSFISGVMKTSYGSSVPSGWLIPLPFINLGRQDAATNGTAKVNIIVPHSEGQSDASYNVYPCFYQITYMRGR